MSIIKRNTILIIYLSISLLLPGIGFCHTKRGETFQAITISKDDRVLILAPHPDDEILSCAGIIQKAKKSGAKIKILYVTEGEHNPISLIAYKQKFIFKNKQKEFIRLGKIRTQESVEATSLLGVSRSDLIFLDYPDSGIMSIFTTHWGKGNEYIDSLTGLSHSAKGEGMIPQAPYIGDAIIYEIKKVIKEFVPTKIFCSHPLDRHSDHIGVYLFLKVSLWELKELPCNPQLYLYLVHFNGWPRPHRYTPEYSLSPPKKINIQPLEWYINKLSPKQILKKEQAIMKFKTQIKYNKQYLLSFVRTNELFSSDLKEINLLPFQPTTLDSTGEIKKISFSYQPESLIISINFFKNIYSLKNINGTIYLFGYNSKKDGFKDAPKIRIGFRSRRYCVYNLGHKLRKGGFKFKFFLNRLIIQAPLKLLGKPDLILYSLKTNLSRNPIDKHSYWRTLCLKH